MAREKTEVGSLLPPSSGPTLSAHVEVVPCRARVRTSPANFRERRQSEVRSVPVLVSVAFCGLLHAELEGEAGEGFLCGVTAESRPLFFGNPASSFHPSFTLWCPLERVFIFHDLILA
jgi:hypothetical protein